MLYSNKQPAVAACVGAQTLCESFKVHSMKYVYTSILCDYIMLVYNKSLTLLSGRFSTTKRR